MPVRTLNEVGISPSLERQIASLTQVVQTMATFMVNIQTKQCGNCFTPGHSTNMCPSLQKGDFEQANALGYQGNQSY